MVSDQSALLQHHENSQTTRQQRPFLATAHTGKASLLLQAASGISNGSSCWQRPTIIGRAVQG